MMGARTRNDTRRALRCVTSAQCVHGFTLLEVLVVLALLAITATAAVPAFLAERARGAERDAATALAGALARVRDGARTSGAPASLVLSPADARVWLVWRDSTRVERLPLAPGLQLAGAAGDRVTCRFDPAGTATPFAVTVQGRVSILVRVAGWTGDITIGDGAPT
jgi:prepilin-type N-terminal cleavage/methylation domain-containing protein